MQWATCRRTETLTNLRRSPVCRSLARHLLMYSIARINAPVNERSRRYLLDYLSLCRQKRQQDAADHKGYDHISKVPMDTVKPGFHALNSHHCAMGDVPPSGKSNHRAMLRWSPCGYE